MTEEQIRIIARQEAEKVNSGNYDAGIVGAHRHNGVDSLKLSQVGLLDFITIPSVTVTSSLTSKANTKSQSFKYSGNLQPNILYGNATSNTFQGGTATEGTVVIFYGNDKSTVAKDTGQNITIGFSATTKGDTTLTITSINGVSAGSNTWPRPTGTYYGFLQGTPNQLVFCSCTNGSATVNFNAAAAGAYTSMVIVPNVQYWIYLNGMWRGSYLPYYSS